MFADITGFTAMSDRLSFSGRLGAEELATIINGVFDPLLDIVFSYGGDVIKFGGDAFLVLFRGKDHTRKAAACGRALLAETARYRKVSTSLGEFPIAIHIGISRGTALSAIIGKRGARYDHLFCGPDVSLAYAAADAAEPGELYVTESCLPYLSNCSLLKKGRYFKVNKAGKSTPARGTRKNPTSEKPAAGIKGCLIRGLWEKLAETSRGRVDGEHRPITTMFIGVDGWFKNLSLADTGKSADFRKINDHIVGLNLLVEKYGGNVARLDVSEGGEKALVLFGAPLLREDAPEDALRAALELRKMTEELSESLSIPIRLRIGINSGTSYAGDVGGSYRREYTAMGKEVNMAARLMSNADWGEIIVGPATLDAVGNNFRTSEKGTYKLKGLDEPIALRTVVDIIERPGSGRKATNLIGREKELKILESFVVKTMAGEGSIIQIFGEAGSGKSVLMEKACNDLLSKDGILLRSACFEHTSNTPLYPLGDILRAALGIYEKDDRNTRKQKLLNVLGKIGISEWEGLVCRPVGYTVRTTPEINNLSENAKRDKTSQLINSIIIDYFAGRNGCIIIDDLHWADATTIEFLNSSLAKLTGKQISLLLVSRISETVPRYESGVTIDLGLLDAESSARLFKSKIGGKAPESFVDEIVKASGGNPFYLEEMAKAVLDMGIESWSKARGIPDSVERVIMARIDRLEEMVKTTIRTASVIGRVFGVEELTGIFPVPGKRSKIRSYLEKSAALDITPIEKTEPVIEYGFKHILTREVAYSGFSFKTRRKLHGALAEYYRKIRLIRGIESGLIGYQYENSETPRLAVPYYMRAGHAAGKVFSNSEAIHYFSKVIELLESHKGCNMAHRAHLGLGRVYRLIGEYEKSELQFRKIIEAYPGRKPWKAATLRELSELYRIRSEFEKATAILTELWVIEKDNPDVAAVYHNGLGDIARRTGELDIALRHFSEGLRFEKGINSGLRAQILNNMGISLWQSGRLDEAISKYRRANEIYKENRDLQGIAKITNNTGIIFEQKGRLRQAAEYYKESSDVFEKIGDRRSQGYCYGNLATNFIIRGLPYEARFYIDRAAELFESIGDREACARTAGNLADWYDLAGDTEIARKYCEKTIELAKALGNEELICETNIRLGRLTLILNEEMGMNLLVRAHREAVERYWRDLELKAEYHLYEWKALRDRGEEETALLEDLAKYMRKEPSPVLFCGAEILFALIKHGMGKIEEARVAFMKAYRVAAKSDLVLERWKILALCGSLWPHMREAAKKRSVVIESRIFENVDQNIAGSLRLGLEHWSTACFLLARAKIEKLFSIVTA